MYSIILAAVVTAGGARRNGVIEAVTVATAVTAGGQAPTAAGAGVMDVMAATVATAAGAPAMAATVATAAGARAMAAGLLRRVLGCQLRLSWLLGRIRRSHGFTNACSRNGAAAQGRERRTGSTKEGNQPRQQGTSHCADGARFPTHR